MEPHDSRSELQTTPTARGLSEMPFTWERTTIPEMPFSLPIGFALNVTADSIQVHAERKGTLGELMGLGTDVDESIAFQKHEIIGIEMFLMPDVPDEVNWSWVRENDLSRVYIRHRDPFGVEDFKSLFTSDKKYWPKALAKLLKERAGIESKVTARDTKDTSSDLQGL